MRYVVLEILQVWAPESVLRRDSHLWGAMGVKLSIWRCKEKQSVCSRLLPAGTENGQTSEEEMCTISSEDERNSTVKMEDAVAGDALIPRLMIWVWRGDESPTLGEFNSSKIKMNKSYDKRWRLKKKKKKEGRRSGGGFTYLVFLLYHVF